MSLNLTEQERSFLVEVLDAKHTSLLDELHHTDTHDYKELLKQQLTLLEGLRGKIGQLPPTDGGTR